MNLSAITVVVEISDGTEVCAETGMLRKVVDSSLKGVASGLSGSMFVLTPGRLPKKAVDPSFSSVVS